MVEPGETRAAVSAETLEQAPRTDEQVLESVLSLVDVSGAGEEARGGRPQAVVAAPFRRTTSGYEVQAGAGFQAIEVAPFVDLEFLADCAKGGYVALVQESAERSSIVGVAQVGRPAVVKVEAREIELVATEQLTLKSGRAALLLRQDGIVELLGTRISAASRGLLRLVGRALRLN